tara:strand:- start:2509 stop:2694 length:186 start_codon:yes stop_codon:yes gene_type:complete
MRGIRGTIWKALVPQLLLALIWTAWIHLVITMIADQSVAAHAILLAVTASLFVLHQTYSRG